jgi:acetylornithine deacetylase
MSSSLQIQESIKTLQQLIGFASVSSESNCQVSDWVDQRLQSLGFEVEQTHYQDASGVAKANVIARRDPISSPDGGSSGGLAYFCHTDVVPPGQWVGPGGDPFHSVIEDDRLYGRGSCDMKGSLAAILTAVSTIDAEQQTLPVWIIATADEEVGFQGAKQMVEHSAIYRQIVDAQPLGIIGEPTEMNVVHAHKGITGFEITSHGRAAHSSTTSGINANRAMVPMLQVLLELCQQTETDDRYSDQRFDPPTLSWNFGIGDGVTAYNITPERSVAWVTLRPMPDIDGADLIQIAKQKAESLGLDFKIYPGGDPLWIEPDADCVKELCQLTRTSPKTVCFGTDGGEFGQLRQRVVWGPGSIDQAHTADEWISLKQLALGTELYAAAIRKWCC